MTKGVARGRRGGAGKGRLPVRRDTGRLGRERERERESMVDDGAHGPVKQKPEAHGLRFLRPTPRPRQYAPL